jgi:cell division protein FtsB
MSPRVVPACLITLLLVLHAQIWFGRGSVSNVSDMQRKLQAQKAANVRAAQANERLASEVRDLREGLEMIEEKARMELGPLGRCPHASPCSARPAPARAPSALNWHRACVRVGIGYSCGFWCAPANRRHGTQHPMPTS